jgi:hypothetical protein
MIFVDYRKKFMLVMPRVEHMSSRRHDFSSKISEAENSAQEISVNIDSVRREISELEDRRQEFQDKLNEREMVFISVGSFKMGSDLVGRENENPEHLAQVKAFYLDRFEVTNLQYKDFIDATGRRCIGKAVISSRGGPITPWLMSPEKKPGLMPTGSISACRRRLSGSGRRAEPMGGSIPGANKSTKTSPISTTLRSVPRLLKLYQGTERVRDLGYVRECWRVG